MRKPLTITRARLRMERRRKIIRNVFIAVAIAIGLFFVMAVAGTTFPY
ncbi:MAG: hypothetical protein JSW40_04025 [Candidatus Omnitrophota bacterium]|nr:MAG: hypothetical protein JSW40_04025 [Candidatus Omnitrophota bacterium]